jgi:hypothetical protein
MFIRKFVKVKVCRSVSYRLCFNVLEGLGIIHTPVGRKVGALGGESPNEVDHLVAGYY